MAALSTLNGDPVCDGPDWYRKRTTKPNITPTCVPQHVLLFIGAISNSSKTTVEKLTIMYDEQNAIASCLTSWFLTENFHL